MGRERFEAEFGCYSEWLVEAVEALAVDPIPAVARGTGNPALLRAAADRLELAPGDLILDVGCGLGAPAAWLESHHDCDVVGVDVMEPSVRGMRRLFSDAKAVVASTRALPFASGSFDGAWALGVLEMVEDKGRALSEIARVLRPGAPLVLYDFVMVGEGVLQGPAADRFVAPEDTFERLRAAAFEIRDARPVEVDPAPESWRRARDVVREEIRARYSSDDRYRVAEEELNAFRALVADKAIEDWFFVAERTA